jgi:transposase
MKKINLAAIFLILSSVTSTVFAEITLQSKEEVEGTWKLESSKNSLNDKDAVKREDTWVFKNGKVTILHIPRDGKYYDQPPVNYEIEDGKLKIALLGNSRFDVFSLEEKDDKSMTLKGKFGGYYYFIKK